MCPGLLHALVEVVGQEVQQSSVFFRQLVHESVNRPHSVFLLVVLCKTRSGEERGRFREDDQSHTNELCAISLAALMNSLCSL